MEGGMDCKGHENLYVNVLNLVFGSSFMGI